MKVLEGWGDFLRSYNIKSGCEPILVINVHELVPGKLYAARSPSYPCEGTGETESLAVDCFLGRNQCYRELYTTAKIKGK